MSPLVSLHAHLLFISVPISITIYLYLYLYLSIYLSIYVYIYLGGCADVAHGEPACALAASGAL